MSVHKATEDIANQQQLSEAQENLSGMNDEQALSFEPKTYAEHKAAASRIETIGANQANRQAIDMGNKQRAQEAYTNSTAAFDEARGKYASGDIKGAAAALAKIGQTTNNPFKARPSEDGKTIEMYFTKDGEDQPGQVYPIEEALQIAQQHLNSEEFFTTHLQNREARKKLNQESLLKPIVFTKGDKKLRAVRELDLNTNQVRWSVYDDKGNLFGGKRISDINELRSKGWKQYSGEGVDADLKREKMRSEIDKNKALADKARRDAGKKAEDLEAKRRKQRKDRLSYVDSALKAADEDAKYRDEVLDSESEDKIRIESEVRYNQEVLRWTPASKNKRTGEIIYKTPNGRMVNKYGQTMQPKKKPVESPKRIKEAPEYGFRADGTKKGPGFLGELKAPDGKVSTELSIGVKLKGKETQIPTLVPTLTKAEIAHLLNGKKPTDVIVQKAIKHAKQRIAQGQSPFKESAATDTINPR